MHFVRRMKRSIALILAICAMLVAPRAGADETEAAHHTAGPWITIGVGSGVAAVGVLSFVGAIKAHDAVQSEAAAKGCTTSPTVACPAGVDATNIKTNLDGERAMNVIGVVLAATGGAAILGGILWHFLERPAPKKTAITIAPTLGGVVIAGQF
jgi:hypothetical protein